MGISLTNTQTLEIFGDPRQTHFPREPKSNKHKPSNEAVEMQRKLETKQDLLRRERMHRKDLMLRLLQTERENLQLREYLNLILLFKLKGSS